MFLIFLIWRRCAKATSLHCDYRLHHKLSPRRAQPPSSQWGSSSNTRLQICKCKYICIFLLLVFAFVSSCPLSSYPSNTIAALNLFLYQNTETLVFLTNFSSELLCVSLWELKRTSCSCNYTSPTLLAVWLMMGKHFKWFWPSCSHKQVVKFTM